MKRGVLFLAAIWVACLMAAPVVRADDRFDFNKYAKKPRHHHDYLNDTTVKVEPEKGSTVRGKFDLTCFSDDHDQVLIHLDGLQKHAVYTVWFTRSLKPDTRRAGLGNAPFDFKTGGGTSHLYEAPTDFCPLKSYHWVEVRLHPDGNPNDLEHSVRVGRVPLDGQ